MTNISSKLDTLSYEMVHVLQWVRSVNISELPLLKTVSEPFKQILNSFTEQNLQIFEDLELSICDGVMKNKSEIGRALIKVVSECLSPNWRKRWLIGLDLKICQTHLKSICDPSLSLNDCVRTYQKFLYAINSTVNNCFALFKGPIHSSSANIYLCLHQIKKNVPLLLTGIEQECIFIRLYSAHCLSACLDRIWNDVREPSEFRCSEFIDLMDSAFIILDQMSETPECCRTQVDHLKEVIDEILCHAMSTAQVSGSDSIKQAIIAKAQSILSTMENLRDEATADDVGRVSWLSTDISEGLCTLERSVNSAVLHLVFSFFSGVSDPLHSLLDVCRDTSLGTREAADLDDLIAEFDVYMDQLMLIGSFAVSCSTNLSKAVQIRSCLASFESLEAELVPTITTLYLETSKSQKLSVRLLLSHWLEETKVFRSLLETIIDPAAFTDVVRSELKLAISELEKDLPDNQAENMKKILKVAKSLVGVIRDLLKQEPSESIELCSKKYEKAIKSCERLYCKVAISNDSEYDGQLLQKTKGLLNRIENLCEELAKQIVQGDQTLEDDDLQISPALALPPSKDYYKLCPAEAEPATPATLEHTPFTPLLKKSGLLVKEAVLYNTPKRSTMKKTPIRATPAPRSSVKRKILSTLKRSSCFRPTDKKQGGCSYQNESVNLTDVLEDLSQLDDTFSLNDTVLPKKPEVELHGRRLLDLFAGWDSLLEDDLGSNIVDGTLQPNTVTNTLVSITVPTPERESDLKLVEERIKSLKMATPKGKNDHYVTIINLD